MKSNVKKNENSMGNQKKLNKLVILCGGTGGHFYPGLTIAKRFQEDNGKAYLFIGGHKDKIEKQISNAFECNIECFTINSSQFKKRPIPLVIFSFHLVSGFLKARKILKKLKPDAVLGMGSFTSLPVSFAAISLNIPIFLHDGNAKIGRANVFLSNWARLTMSAFPAVNKNILKSDYICTGMPIRPELIKNKYNRDDAFNEINFLYNVNFKPENETILIFGGSQGALTINKTVPEAVKLINNKTLQVIHLFGNEIDNPYKSILNESLTLHSSDRMDLLYTVADLVISRSGGSTVAELEYFQKNAILIPLPFATDLHQNSNAEYYINKSNSSILLNKDCNENSLKDLIIVKLKYSEKNIKKNTIYQKAEEKILYNIEKRI